MRVLKAKRIFAWYYFFSTGLDVELQDGFFVSRKDNLNATCISRDRYGKNFVSFYDLG